MSPSIIKQKLTSIGSRPKIKMLSTDDANYYQELGKTAKEIVYLKSAFSIINANEDELAADRVSLRLTAAEQEFFLLFNNLRTNMGLEPLKGERFTGDFSYKSYLYDV